MSTQNFNFLLLSSTLGDPNRKPLTTAQLRLLGQRISFLSDMEQDNELDEGILDAMGLDRRLSSQILMLLEDTLQLKAYIRRGEKAHCFPVPRNDLNYPPVLRKRLGLDAPGCLWYKGNLDILKMKSISLVGSRILSAANEHFAQQVGIQAARQGYVLVSGNAKGADTTAQKACLAAGGFVVSVVADPLENHPLHGRILYISEDDFDAPFSTIRALHRNRVIHALGLITFAAQCTLGKGGTWDGSLLNLRNRWSPLFCFRDHSAASSELERLGATLVDLSDLESFSDLSDPQMRFF